MVSVPRLVVAAPASGHGKTTVATGLMAALRARGLAVSGHKAGPDYIDPGYHALATGRAARNLDPVLCGECLIASLFAHGAAGADVAVVEGVMGLFDGRGSGSDGSTAHIATLLTAPVVLVVDASAQGRSVAALVSGFAAFDPAVRVAGVILNRVGSARHEQILRDALAGIGMRVFGALRRDAAIATPSRHLGLVPTAEREGPATQALGRLAALVAGCVDLDAVLAVARSAGPLHTGPWDPASALARPGQEPALSKVTSVTEVKRETLGSPASPRRRPVVAVAGGAAFSFCYTETVELLAAAGADVVIVDPLRDECLPAGTTALVLGGGFPEVHAAGLSANERLRADVGRLVRSGAPVAAECAGLLYLVRDVDGVPMCGVIAASARMTARLAVGYRDAVAATDSALAPAGTRVRGHEFHRTTVEPAFAPAVVPPASGQRPEQAGGARSAQRSGPAWRLGGRPEGFVRGNVHASYLHLHWAGYPGIAARLVAAAAAAATEFPPTSGRSSPPAARPVSPGRARDPVPASVITSTVAAVPGDLA